jgi:hypothetical protein
MREDFVHGATPRRAVIVGFEHGSRVVLAAAIIMASVFVAFVFDGSTGSCRTSTSRGSGSPGTWPRLRSGDARGLREAVASVGSR